MKSINKQGWTYGELALAVGMRALGEDAETIGGMLNREPKTVTQALAFARGLLAKEGWPALLLRNQDALERRLRNDRPDDPDRVEPFRPRRAHPAPVITRPDHARDVTAERLGDPTPEQRARIAERDTQEAEPKRPRRYF
ncbi:hypothetical protein C8N35_102105 [Breoghania corrubedonensis]|uniref:Uncharacterized protein n=1 Tax=Breoghania corrubedonensis TaxID=665038 RepID=A0A2T5VCC5_9HYPH|nr:hypothetical protein [Breoghania corrubedonensis]PTW61396.1 hypothetical protein C8N35_102105 [Breoghania corrubedonensis]